LVCDEINARVVLTRLTFENYRRWMFKKYAQKIGFDTSGLKINTLPPLYNFTKLPTVTMTMSELEFPHKLAKNMIYLGPMVHENRIIGKEFDSEMKNLETIFDQKIKRNKKLIYCSVGSLAQGYLPFLKNVIAAVKNETDWIMILSIGPKMNIDTFKSTPENVHIFNWVPQLKVIKESDCAIVSCGLNTIHECLHFKVPMLFYSGHYTDQNGNAARMAYHGLGIRGNIHTDTSEQINHNLKRIFEDDSFKKTVIKFHSKYQEYRQRELSPFLLD